ncbi:TldD/PmbA family protein, partial [bacterium]|nr:TldD/PmbA family protein [bacterium]
DESSFKWAVEQAYNILHSQPDNKDLLPLLKYQEYKPVDNFNWGTASFSPEDRAEVIGETIKSCEKNGLQAAGILQNEFGYMALGNTKGLFAYYPSTAAVFSLTTEGEEVSGWSECNHRAVDQIDFEKLTEKAIRLALDSRNPKTLEPGEYEVILEPAAVAEFLIFMSYMSFGAQTILEGTSFLKDKFGQKVFDDKISIIDDAYHPMANGIPFDYEGMPRERVPIIEKGIFRGVVHSRITASRMNAQTTGHELPQPNPYGPIPLNLLIEPGNSSIEEMISSTKKGILVTHFHYTNILDHMKMNLTGMTRDGTFMVENGRVAYPIKNMRFTESIIKALSNVEFVGSELESAEAFFGGSFLVPALKLRSFRFSSGTEF